MIVPILSLATVAFLFAFILTLTERITNREKALIFFAFALFVTFIIILWRTESSSSELQFKQKQEVFQKIEKDFEYFF